MADLGEMTGQAMADDAVRDFDLHAAPGHLLRRCQQFAVDAYLQEVGANGLRPRQFALLHTICMNEGLSQTELVRLTGIDRSTIAEMLRRLTARGLLRRRRAANDHRINVLALTPKGRRALDDAIDGVRRAQEVILARLPEDRRRRFVDDLTLVAGLGAADPADAGR